MNQLQTPDAGTAQPEPMSFTDKVVNLFASPGELFENVRQTPITHSNWLIPTLILVVVGTLMSYLVMSNPSIADQYARMSSEQVEKQIQKSIQDGRMTEEQAEQAREQASRFGATGMLISRLAASAIGPFFVLFVVGLVYWLLGKGVMKAAVPYFKVVEVVGFTFLISVLESIVTTILVITLDRAFATPSLSLFIADFSINDKWHMLAATMNIFTFWNLGVVSIGLSRVFQRDFAKVLVLVVALWLIWTAAMVFGLSSLRG